MLRDGSAALLFARFLPALSALADLRRGIRRLPIFRAGARTRSMVVAVGIATVFGCSPSDGTNELDALIEPIRAAGEPVTLGDLDRSYDAGPDGAENGKNLATILAMIKQPLDPAQVIYVSAEKDVEPGDAIPENVLNDTRRYFGEHREIVSRIHEIVDGGARARYPADLNLGADVPLEHFAHIRSGTRLLAIEALIGAVEADAGRSARALRDAIALADTLRDEPLLISQLVRVACLAIACSAMEDAVNRTQFSPAELSALQRRVESIDLSGMIGSAIVGERTWAVADFVEGNSTPRPMLDLWKETAPETAARYESRQYYAGETAQLVRDYNELITIGRGRLEGRVAAAQSLADEVERRADDGNLLSKTLVPALGDTYDAEARAIMLLRVSAVGLALERYRSERQAVPAELSELTPAWVGEVHGDLLGGGPIKYRRSGAGAVVYSVGPDGNDDSGQPAPDGVSLRDDGDIVFRLVALR